MTLLERLRAMPPGSLVPVDWLLAELQATTAAPVPVEPSANGAGAAGEPLLTVEEAAERFAVTPQWLYRNWRKVGGVKLGRKVLRFPAGALPRYLASRGKARA